MINLSFLWHPTFWFTTRTPLLEESARVLFFFFLLLFILSVASKYHLRPSKEDRLRVLSWKRLNRLLSIMGFFGLVLLFFSYEGVYWFQGRFWFLLWGLFTIGWGISICWFHFRTAPRLRSGREARAEQTKYLPRTS